ncbi:MAG: ABC transporter permease subunit [Anaerolineales bacterium]
MNILSKKQDEPKSQAELLYDLQLRKERHFRANVALSWGVLILILVFLFSGQDIKIGSYTFNTIHIDTNFIVKQIGFIALGLGETIRISVMSIMLAMILALLAALGRLSTFPLIYALSTFYVSLIRGTPLYLQIFFFFLALPQLDIRLSGFTAGVWHLD